MSEVPKLSVRLSASDFTSWVVLVEQTTKENMPFGSHPITSVELGWSFAGDRGILAKVVAKSCNSFGSPLGR